MKKLLFFPLLLITLIVFAQPKIKSLNCILIKQNGKVLSTKNTTIQNTKGDYYLSINGIKYWSTNEYFKGKNLFIFFKDDGTYKTDLAHELMLNYEMLDENVFVLRNDNIQIYFEQKIL